MKIDLKILESFALLSNAKPFHQTTARIVANIDNVVNVDPI